MKASAMGLCSVAQLAYLGPTSDQIFHRLANLDCCWTAQRLTRHGLPHLYACVLCDQAPETMQRLSCPFLAIFGTTSSRCAASPSPYPPPTLSSFNGGLMLPRPCLLPCGKGWHPSCFLLHGLYGNIGIHASSTMHDPAAGTSCKSSKIGLALGLRLEHRV
jgi:hypothetical protein